MKRTIHTLQVKYNRLIKKIPLEKKDVNCLNTKYQFMNEVKYDQAKEIQLLRT